MTYQISLLKVTTTRYSTFATCDSCVIQFREHIEKLPEAAAVPEPLRLAVFGEYQKRLAQRAAEEGEVSRSDSDRDKRSHRVCLCLGVGTLF